MTYGDDMESATSTKHYLHLEHCHCHKQDQMCTDIKVAEMLATLSENKNPWSKSWCKWAQAWLAGEITDFSLWREDTLLERALADAHWERYTYSKDSDLAASAGCLADIAARCEKCDAEKLGNLEYIGPCGHAAKYGLYLVEKGKANNPVNVNGTIMECGVCRECSRLQDEEKIRRESRREVGDRLCRYIDYWVHYGKFNELSDREDLIRSLSFISKETGAE